MGAGAQPAKAVRGSYQIVAGASFQQILDHPVWETFADTEVDHAVTIESGKSFRCAKP
jgi:hypothetical protein